MNATVLADTWCQALQAGVLVKKMHLHSCLNAEAAVVQRMSHGCCTKHLQSGSKLHACCMYGICYCSVT